MKKTVISTGGKQYLVSEGDEIEVELLKDVDKSVSFPALLVVDGEKIEVGAPEVSGVKVSAEVVHQDEKSDKTLSIRYKSKKRVHTVKGHRQRYTTLKITSIK